MTAATSLRQPNISRAPGALILVAALTFLSGVATTVALEGASPADVGGTAAAQAAPTFDAVTFRAEERAGSYPEPTFDAVTFRAEERAGSYPEPTFDAVTFRAEERAASYPGPTAVKVRAERHHISLRATLGTGPTSGNERGR